jgi:DnaK suppressor protein
MLDMSEKENINIEQFRKVLIERKGTLVDLMQSSLASREPVELDQTRQGRLSRQDALMQQEMAKETHRRREAELVRIDAALARIDSGDFGFCVQCDEPIAEKRLNLDPSVPVCVDCAS